MNDDPAEVDVVYAKITDNASCLQAVADALVEKFVAAGLMARYVQTIQVLFFAPFPATQGNEGSTNLRI